MVFHDDNQIHCFNLYNRPERKLLSKHRRKSRPNSWSWNFRMPSVCDSIRNSCDNRTYRVDDPPHGTQARSAGSSHWIRDWDHRTSALLAMLHRSLPYKQHTEYYRQGTLRIDSVCRYSQPEHSQKPTVNACIDYFVDCKRNCLGIGRLAMNRVVRSRNSTVDSRWDLWKVNWVIIVNNGHVDGAN